MSKYYSQSAAGFFDSVIHGAKGKKGSSVPRDAVAISDEEHASLMAEQANGKRIVAVDGGAAARDPDLTPEEFLAAIRRGRDRALAATDWTQIPDALDEAKRQLWAMHRQALRDLPARVGEAVAAGDPPAGIAFPEPPATDARTAQPN